MSIRSRLERLERDVPGATCRTCGYDPGEPFRFTMLSRETTSSVFEPVALPEPERCPACGRETKAFTIAIDRAGDGDDEYPPAA